VIDLSEFKKYGIYFNIITESSIISVHPHMKIPEYYDLEKYGHMLDEMRNPENIKELLVDENGNNKNSRRLDIQFETILVQNDNLDFVMDCKYVFYKNPFENLSDERIKETLAASKKHYTYSDLLSRNIIVPKETTSGKGLIANDPNHSEGLSDVEKIVYADKPFHQKWSELESLGVEAQDFIDEHARVYGGKFQSEDIETYYFDLQNKPWSYIYTWNQSFPIEASKCENFIRNWLNEDNYYDILNYFFIYGFNFKETNKELIDKIYREKFPTRDQVNMTEEIQ
jgi:hypothetical protein